uniref:Putative NosL protein n=1 Tax=uncultured bacterium 1042 TaxID=548897 RepID=B8R8U4_9BACT|nr:putative NosL protein [uncultured bacterium 1042]
MRRPLLAAALTALLGLSGCGDEGQAPPPKPYAMTESAIGHYCGMNVLEHPGPKGQISLASNPEPIWFSSARDAVAFTMLPEEPKDVAAIFVSDMAKAASWESPGEENWVDAKQAFYVIGSAMRGGMGAEETVPFSDQASARKFAEENGGKIVGFADIPRDYVLGAATGGSEPNGESVPNTDGTTH